MWKWIIILLICFVVIQNTSAFTLNDISWNATGIGSGINLKLFGNFSFNNISMNNTPSITGSEIFLDTFLDYYIYNQTSNSFSYQPTNQYVNITFIEANNYYFYDKANLTELLNDLRDSEGNLITNTVNLTSSSNNLTKRIASSMNQPINITLYSFVDSCNNIDTPNFTSDTKTYSTQYSSSDYVCNNNLLELNISGIELASSSNELIMDSVVPITTVISPDDGTSFSQGTTNVTINYNLIETNPDNCTISYDGLSITDNSVVNGSNSFSAGGLLTNTYTYNIQCWDDLGNVNTSTNRTFIIAGIGSGSSAGGGGGGLTITQTSITCETEDTNWTASPNKFRAFVWKDVKRDFELGLVNNADKNVTIDLKCQNDANSTIDICNYMNLSESKINLPANALDIKVVKSTLFIDKSLKTDIGNIFPSIILSDGKECKNVPIALELRENPIGIVNKNVKLQFSKLSANFSDIFFPLIVISMFSFFVLTFLSYYLFKKVLSMGLSLIFGVSISLIISLLILILI